MAKKHSRDARIYVDDADISGHSAAMTLALPRTLAESTAFGDSGRKHIGNLGDETFDLEALYDDAAAGGSDEVLADWSANERVVTFWPAGDALSAIGWGQGTLLPSDTSFMTRVGDIVKITARGPFNGLADRLKSLGAKATVTATTNGTSIDDAAASSAGGTWVFHVTVFSATGGNARWQVVLQDSADNVTFATVGSESVNVTAAVGTRRTFTGTLRRYVRTRVVLDATSGSLTFQASYQRG